MYKLIHDNKDNLSEDKISELWQQGKSRCGYCLGASAKEWEIICDCLLFQQWDAETLQIASFGIREALDGE